MYCILYILYILYTVHIVHVPCFPVSDVEISHLFAHLFTLIHLSVHSHFSVFTYSHSHSDCQLSIICIRLVIVAHHHLGCVTGTASHRVHTEVVR